MLAGNWLLSCIPTTVIFIHRKRILSIDTLVQPSQHDSLLLCWKCPVIIVLLSGNPNYTQEGRETRVILEIIDRIHRVLLNVKFLIYSV